MTLRYPHSIQCVRSWILFFDRSFERIPHEGKIRRVGHHLTTQVRRCRVYPTQYISSAAARERSDFSVSFDTSGREKERGMRISCSNTIESICICGSSASVSEPGGNKLLIIWRITEVSETFSESNSETWSQTTLAILATQIEQGKGRLWTSGRASWHEYWLVIRWSVS